MYEGITKSVLKYFGFLLKYFNMEFAFRSFSEYNGFYGPSDCYCFYNRHGCFTLHNLVQRGEWGCFVSKQFSDDQKALLYKEIALTDYIDASYLSVKKWFKAVSQIIIKEIETNGSVFSIIVD